MIDWQAVTVSTLHRGVLGATPLLLAATGELIGQRAGLLNIGIEGVMLAGALAGAAVGWWSGSAMAGLLAAAAVGALIGLVYAIWTVWAARDQIVTGLAINLLALGLTGVILERLDAVAAAQQSEFTSPRLPPIVSVDVEQQPLMYLFASYDGVVLATLILVTMTVVLLNRSRPGLVLRAVGENPEAVETAGYRVAAVRTIAAMIASALTAVGGAHLAMGISDRFQENMTAGRGFVALALVIFGRWSPARVALAALFFGMLDALQVTLQPHLGRHVHLLYPA
ncbi:MAG: ABC transporter permease, partial [Phycisphaerae bacterium]